ncbi:Methylamine utilization protein MauE [Desulfosporosinus acidiphilus SJ4]|uniref:Methylamine utilization protein MauE n=1 Tax=Desulfosporosinus acidiphilus (strain DSM 22704 / JCM 16185 / SJ4) TaxID=646529 RepID=I4D5Y0_DESAJ|nr:MauE/DoxX family redox-associated membrane protein [Desulfosporosinus acidiphilus]AFM41204.1 Methylamine utilization protein MauE [Desulfosporosinus acidiphilus SJ4]
MILLKLLLAGIYLYAGVSKILNLYLFKATILAYYPFMPVYIALLITIVFPWLEILSGLSLGLNWQGKYASLFLLLLSLFFLVQTVLNYSHVLPYGCGCFGFSGPEKITLYYVIRDFSIMILAGIVCFREWKKNILPKPGTEI